MRGENMKYGIILCDYQVKVIRKNRAAELRRKRREQIEAVCIAAGRRIARAIACIF
jgi:hypothetical protein